MTTILKSSFQKSNNLGAETTLNCHQQGALLYGIRASQCMVAVLPNASLLIQALIQADLNYALITIESTPRKKTVKL